MPTTTIEITETQKDVLDEIKDHEKEPYKQVLGRLLEVYDDAHHDPIEDHSGVDADELVAELAAEIDSMAFNGQVSDDRADEIIGRLEDLESSIPERTADELEGRLR